MSCNTTRPAPAPPLSSHDCPHLAIAPTDWALVSPSAFCVSGITLSLGARAPLLWSQANGNERVYSAQLTHERTHSRDICNINDSEKLPPASSLGDAPPRSPALTPARRDLIALPSNASFGALWVREHFVASQHRAQKVVWVVSALLYFGVLGVCGPGFGRAWWFYAVTIGVPVGIAGGLWVEWYWRRWWVRRAEERLARNGDVV